MILKIEQIINPFRSRYGDYHERYFKGLDEIAEKFSSGKMLHDRVTLVIVESYHAYLSGAMGTREFVGWWQSFISDYNDDDENVLVDYAHGDLEAAVQKITDPLKDGFREYFTDKLELIKRIATEVFNRPALSDSLNFIENLDLVLLGRQIITEFINNTIDLKL